MMSYLKSCEFQTEKESSPSGNTRRGGVDDGLNNSPDSNGVFPLSRSSYSMNFFNSGETRTVSLPLKYRSTESFQISFCRAPITLMVLSL